MKTRNDQNLWNIVYMVFFVGIVFLGMWLLSTQRGGIPTSIPVFDLVLIILATFQIVRLFVYDQIMSWIRDIFLNKTVLEGDDGELVITRSKHVSGPLLTASELLGCPWCFSVWSGFFVLFFYFYIPTVAWYVILFLSVSGVASFVQLLANMVGWNAEYLKEKTKQL